MTRSSTRLHDSCTTSNPTFQSLSRSQTLSNNFFLRSLATDLLCRGFLFRRRCKR
ncbi:unnamed protein product [Arabidopsis halleri]